MKLSEIVVGAVNFAVSPATGTPLGDQFAAVDHLPSVPTYVRSTAAAAAANIAAAASAALSKTCFVVFFIFSSLSPARRTTTHLIGR